MLKATQGMLKECRRHGGLAPALSCGCDCCLSSWIPMLLLVLEVLGEPGYSTLQGLQEDLGLVKGLRKQDGFLLPSGVKILG